MVGIVALIDYEEVHQTSCFADGPYDRDRGSSIRDEHQLHVRLHPAAVHLLPKVEGGLVNVDDLIVCLGDDDSAQLVHELLLLLLQVLVLSVGLEVLVVCSSEPHPISLVAASQSVLVQGL